jgi:RNA polymerase sigma-70 factor (ECF subfamily)
VDYTGLDDAALIRLVAHQKSEALSELYDRFGRLIYSVAYNAVGSQETAEEIVQDVFTRVWEKAGTYDVDLAKVSTWLISITRNRSIDELRRVKVRPEHNSVGWADVEPSHIPLSDNPEDEVEASWQQRVVRRAVAALPEDQQKALALAFFRGYSHSEIAEALGEPLGTVKTRIRMAMKKLRQVMVEQKVVNGR